MAGPLRGPLPFPLSPWAGPGAPRLESEGPARPPRPPRELDAAADSLASFFFLSMVVHSSTWGLGAVGGWMGG